MMKFNYVMILAISISIDRLSQRSRVRIAPCFKGVDIEVSGPYPICPVFPIFGLHRISTVFNLG